MCKRNGVVVVLFAAAATAACAQADRASTASPARPEVGLSFSWVHTNAPSANCGCFDIVGGNGTFAWPVSRWHFSPVADITVANTSTAHVASSSYSLTMSTFTAGGRYYVPAHLGQFAPFGEALVGVAHASGSLVQAPNPGASNAGAALAAQAGGGLDLNTSPRFALRLVEADYLFTGFNNSADNHQNNVRLAAGIILRF
jgi:outer membrane immunogenic protein